MKPFNLEEALAGKPVMLRNGRKAYVRHHETELPADRDTGLTGFRFSGIRLSWCESGDSYITGDPSEYGIIGMYPDTGEEE